MCPAPGLVCLPGLGTRLAGEIGASLPSGACVLASTVPEAVARASELMGLMGDGGVVLFSPAAPTPVVEGSYVQRGALFNEAVRDMVGAARS
jgi:UDP-N-acetylmuramoylalanine-D-glutamate ligase